MMTCDDRSPTKEKRRGKEKFSSGAHPHTHTRHMQSRAPMAFAKGEKINLTAIDIRLFKSPASRSVDCEIRP